MCLNNDNIGLVAYQLNLAFNSFVSRFKYSALNAFFAAVPKRNVRSNNTDNCNFNPIAIEYDMTSSRNVIAFFILYVCGKNREVSLSHDFFHCCNSPVEFMVSKRKGVVFQCIKSCHHRMRQIRIFIEKIIRHYGSLNGIPCIN